MFRGDEEMVDVSEVLADLEVCKVFRSTQCQKFNEVSTKGLMKGR